MKREAKPGARRRIHGCACGFRTLRYVHRNTLPCPKCGGHVVLIGSNRDRGPMSSIEINVPTRWLKRLELRTFVSRSAVIRRALALTYGFD